MLMAEIKTCKKHVRAVACCACGRCSTTITANEKLSFQTKISEPPVLKAWRKWHRFMTLSALVVLKAVSFHGSDAPGVAGLRQQTNIKKMAELGKQKGCEDHISYGFMYNREQRAVNAGVRRSIRLTSHNHKEGRFGDGAPINQIAFEQPNTKPLAANREE